MSQQSEFHYSEQENRPEPPLDRDPQERQNWSDDQNQSPDYLTMQQMNGQKIYPPSPRRRRRWPWIVVIVIVILLLLSGTGYISNSILSKTSVLPTRTFTVTGTPTLVVGDAAGVVRIHQGSGDKVVVSAVAHGNWFSNLNADLVKEVQDTSADSITIAVADNGLSASHGSVNLDITLPATSNIQATVNAGNLDVNGISGQMNLHMNAGALHFENGIIQGQSSFKNNAGEITFDGAFAPNGKYDFENNVGAINLILPSDTAFTLTVSSNLGKVNNDFGANIVGTNPTSQLNIHNNLGAVNIRKK